VNRNREIEEPRGALQTIDLAVVIPTLNEAASIGGVIDRIQTELKDYSAKIIVVDGHSMDSTRQIAAQRGADVIRQRRLGYGDALRTGFLFIAKNLNAKVVIMLDGDGTYDPADIPKVIRPILEDEADLVIGNRFAKPSSGEMTSTNRAGNRVISWLARKMLRLNISDTQCGLRAFDADLLDDLTLSNAGMPFALEMISDAWLCDARITQVDISYGPRQGKAKLRPFRDGFKIVATLIRLTRDTQPLVFFGGIALILAIFGLYFGIEVTLQWLRFSSISQIPTVILSALFLMGAIQFVTIGLMSDMLKAMRKSLAGKR
jgi:dolichol-phosphate hexosyltransferase